MDHDPSMALRPQGCTNLKLRQLMRRVAALYDEEVGQSGLRGTQYSLLSHVVKMGPVRAVDLAQAMKLNTSTLSRNLQPLVAAGWVQVRPGADARSRLVSATVAGQDKRREAQLLWRVAQERVNALLGPAQVVALHAMVDQALQRLEQAGVVAQPEEAA
ncbi:MAG: MarR family winged helix-turn-helix transcriptional regulator [Rhodoferax sp.]